MQLVPGREVTQFSMLYENVELRIVLQCEHNVESNLSLSETIHLPFHFPKTRLGSGVRSGPGYYQGDDAGENLTAMHLCLCIEDHL